MSADDTSIICSHRGKPETVAKSDISSIKLARRGRSTLVGAGIGAGAGAIIGAAADHGNDAFDFKREVIGGLAILGAAVGAGIGAATDFVPSTIFRAH